MDLVIAIYRVTETFPKTEMYALANQMQRSAVSVPSNIAEGYGLKQTQAYLRHLAVASGSLCELETQLEISDRLRYLKSGKELILQANEVGKMLSGLRQSLRKRLNPGS